MHDKETLQHHSRLGFLLELAEVTVVGALVRKGSRGVTLTSYPNPRRRQLHARHTMAYKEVGPMGRAPSCAAMCPLDFKPVVQARYEPRNRY